MLGTARIASKNIDKLHYYRYSQRIWVIINGHIISLDVLNGSDQMLSLNMMKWN